MSEDGIRDDPATFDERLRKARAEAGLDKPAAEPVPPASLAGYALRLATELVAGVIVGAFIGWWVDKTFNTSPWGLIGFFVIGAAAGTLNVIRAVKKLNAQLKTGAPAASVPDDPEDDD